MESMTLETWHLANVLLIVWIGITLAVFLICSGMDDKGDDKDGN